MLYAFFLHSFLTAVIQFVCRYNGNMNERYVLQNKDNCCERTAISSTCREQQNQSTDEHLEIVIGPKKAGEQQFNGLTRKKSHTESCFEKPAFSN